MSSLLHPAYAEWLPRLDPNEVIEPGDVVGVFAGNVTKTTRDAYCILAVTTNPAMLANPPTSQNSTLYEQVALLGQTPIKVRDKVNLGDYILPSGASDGIGIAVSPQQLSPQSYNTVIGRAWETAQEGGIKRIKVIVGLYASYPQVAELLPTMQAQQEDIKALKAEVKNLKRLLAI